MKFKKGDYVKFDGLKWNVPQIVYGEVLKLNEPLFANQSWNVFTIQSPHLKNGENTFLVSEEHLIKLSKQEIMSNFSISCFHEWITTGYSPITGDKWENCKECGLPREKA